MDVESSAVRRLIHAAFEGDLTTVTELLDAGCDVNAPDPETESTALLSAVENVQVAMVELLLARGAHVNQPGYGGWTPLHNAIDIGLEEAKQRSDMAGRFVPVDTTIVSLLLAKGADPYQVDARGQSAFDVARDTGNTEAERLLRAHAPADSR
jgi:ankyrin repeat protein